MRNSAGVFSLNRLAALMLWTTAAVSLLGASAGGCSYDPRFKDHTLQCSSSGECPDNYSCSPVDKTCVSAKEGAGTGGSGTGGTGTGGMGTITPDAGTTDRGGTGGAPIATVNRFIGTWLLGPTSTVTTLCANSPTPIVTMLSPPSDPSRMTITAGMPGQYDLDSAWLYPSLHLRVDDAGAHLSDDRSYSDTGSGDVATQTWTATQFDILANNGTTAMHVAAYTRIDQYTAAAGGKAVTCMQMVSAPLTKQ
ncbi:MAG: hypothetical protein ABI560_04360 [Myxococcales bacterium]